MKKVFYLLLFLLCFCIILTGCSNVKNNTGIDKQDIENRILYNKITNSTNKVYLKDVFGDDFEDQYKSVILPEKEEEIKESLIKDFAIVKCCKEKGILIEKDTAIQYASLEFVNLKTDDSQEQYASALERVLSENKISENDYLMLLHDYAYYKYNSIALKAYFKKNLYNDTENTTLDEQFYAFVETLLE